MSNFCGTAAFALKANNLRRMDSLDCCLGAHGAFSMRQLRSFHGNYEDAHDIESSSLELTNRRTILGDGASAVNEDI